MDVQNHRTIAWLPPITGRRWMVVLAGLLAAVGGYLIWPFLYPYLYLYLAPTPPPPPLAGLAVEMRQVSAGEGLEGGSIYIPAIKLRSGLVEGVELRDLDWGIGHLPGSAMPGEDGNVVLIGHNFIAGGKIHFTLLHKAAVGDSIYLFSNGKRYLYQINGRKIVEPSDIEVAQKSPTAELTMITCYPPGTTKKRLVMTAKPVLSR